MNVLHFKKTMIVLRFTYLQFQRKSSCWSGYIYKGLLFYINAIAHKPG